MNETYGHIRLLSILASGLWTGSSNKFAVFDEAGESSVPLWPGRGKILLGWKSYLIIDKRLDILH